jgi:NAD-dependent deacetylase
MTNTLFVTGAGISANAGIGTYRGDSSLSSWTDGELERKSHANAYGNHLDELWDKHWGPLHATLQVAEPTIAHRAIADWQKHHYTIIATQNIDNLHEKAGSDNVAHVHGVMDVRCMRCKKITPAVWQGVGAPGCSHCGSRKTRPDVVLFGEMLDKAQWRGLESWSRQISLLVVVGSSLWVHPIAGLVMDLLSAKDVHTVLVNKGHAEFKRWFKETHDGDADEILPGVLDSLR